MTKPKYRNSDYILMGLQALYICNNITTCCDNIHLKISTLVYWCLCDAQWCVWTSMHLYLKLYSKEKKVLYFILYTTMKCENVK